MTKRLARISKLIPKGKVFADIGCDHGYVTEYVLKNGLCEVAYPSDVSEKSLKKAEKLLSPYIQSGRCEPCVSDGFDALPQRADVAVIAGLGGEEILKIVKRAYIPEKFVFQPMKNSEKLRRYLVESGCRIEVDTVFSEGGKYYDLIAGKNFGGDTYSELEYCYGRDSLTKDRDILIQRLQRDLRLLDEILKSGKPSPEHENEIVKNYRQTEDLLHELAGNL